jgi:hypothetical protein
MDTRLCASSYIVVKFSQGGGYFCGLPLLENMITNNSEEKECRHTNIGDSSVD